MMKLPQALPGFSKPVIAICLGWLSFVGGILIEDSAVSLPLAAIARALP